MLTYNMFKRHMSKRHIEKIITYLIQEVVGLAKKCTSYYVLLGILSIGESSGYDIKKKIESEIGYIYKVSNGQIYPLLKKMVDENSATFKTDKTVGRPERKVYKITDQGLEILKDWIKAPVDIQIDNENELLLKLYFGSVESIRYNLALVQNFKEIKEKNLQAYDQITEYFNLNTLNTLSDYYSFFTLRFGQIVAKAYIDWSSEVIAVLKGLDSGD